MRKVLVGLAVVLALGGVGHAQTPANVARATLASAWDLDGEAADADQVVALAALADSTTYTIAADPDTCRLVDITVTDANSSISAGVLTVTGVGCLGEAKVCSFTFAAGGSGVKTLTCTDGLGAYIADVTNVSTGVLTGEGAGDEVTVGYTSNSVNGWPMYGNKIMGPAGEYGVDPFGYEEIRIPITTAGVLSSTLDGVSAAADAFARVSVGDLIVVSINGRSYERKVTAKASDDQVTVNAALNIPGAGITYRLRKFWFSTNPAHIMAIPVSGWNTLLVDWSVDANANTGGVVTLLQCTQERVEFPTAGWVQVKTDTIASGSSQAPTSESINLSLLPYSYCRYGFRFGTGDDADAAAEDINVSISLMK